MITFTTLFISILFVIVFIEALVLLYLFTATKATFTMLKVINTTIMPIHEWYKRVVSASWHETKGVTETVKEQMIDDKA